MVVTPQIAQEFLTHNVKNRNLKLRNVHKMAKAMREGKWQLNPEGISFYENGEMRNGQHRCHAIIEANVPVVMTVTYDVPNDSIICDRESPRSQLDILNMTGAPASVCQKSIVALTNTLFYICGSVAPNSAYLCDFCTDEADYLSAVFRMASKGEKDLPRRAPVMSAVYVAYRYGVSAETLDRFCSVIGTGFYSNDGETAAIVIRNKLLEYGATWGKTNRHILFRATLRAIYDFERGVSRKKMYKDDPNPPYFDHVKDNVLSKYL